MTRKELIAHYGDKLANPKLTPQSRRIALATLGELKYTEDLERENPTMAYLAHPYGGKPENVASAAQIRTRLQTAQPAVTLFSPVEHFSPLEGLAGEPEVLRHCLTVLARCDALWAAPGHEGSKGCALEIAYAHAHGIPVLYVEAADD